MQFSVLAVVSFVAFAMATPIALPQPLEDAPVAKRQVSTEAAAMTDASGAVVAFNSAAVVKTGKVKRQVSTEAAAMTDASGAVVAFNSAAVVKTGKVKRQVSTEAAAMTDASGAVVAFNSAAVVKTGRKA